MLYYTYSIIFDPLILSHRGTGRHFGLSPMVPFDFTANQARQTAQYAGLQDLISEENIFESCIFCFDLEIKIGICVARVFREVKLIYLPITL